MHHSKIIIKQVKIIYIKDHEGFERLKILGYDDPNKSKHTRRWNAVRFQFISMQRTCTRFGYLSYAPEFQERSIYIPERQLWEFELSQDGYWKSLLRCWRGKSGWLPVRFNGAAPLFMRGLLIANFEAQAGVFSHRKTVEFSDDWFCWVGFILRGRTCCQSNTGKPNKHKYAALKLTA